MKRNNSTKSPSGFSLWLQHINWVSGPLIVIISIFTVTSTLYLTGVYTDKAVVPKGAQLVNVSKTDPEPTFFIVRDGDQLILTRDRTAIATWLTIYMTIITLMSSALLYQTYCDVTKATTKLDRQMGFGRLLLLLLPLMIAIWGLGAFPLVAVGERIVLNPKSNSLTINGTGYARLGDITGFDAHWTHRLMQRNNRERLIAHLKPTGGVILDALWLGEDVTHAPSDSKSTVVYLNGYLTEIQRKYPAIFN